MTSSARYRQSYLALRADPVRWAARLERQRAQRAALPPERRQAYNARKRAVYAELTADAERRAELRHRQREAYYRRRNDPAWLAKKRTQWLKAANKPRVQVPNPRKAPSARAIALAAWLAERRAS